MSRRAVPVAIPLDALPDALAGGTVAIGNFDGMHRGHQAVLARALARQRPVVALTFEPHPRSYFAGRSLFRITPEPHKARLMAALGLDAMVVETFDARLAAMPAEDFVRDVLVGRLAARAVVVGHDFHFGARRRGNAGLLAAMAPACGFVTEVVEGLADAEGIISSSRIRAHLGGGEVDAAARLLGWRWSVSAEVIHGEKRGRTLGYPTANQALDPATELAHGIYAVRIRIGGAWHDGVASFGRRPTFDDGPPLLETFVFDFAGDLYGHVLDVAFVRFLRPELKFSDLAALVAQMDADAAAARAALAGLEPLSALDGAVNFG